MDKVDIELVDALMTDGRASWASLALEVGLSAPSVKQRVQRLREAGVVGSFEARIDPEAVGYGLLAFISVGARESFDPPEFFQKAQEMDRVQECHILTGEYDYLLKVRCRDSEDLYAVLKEIQTWPGVGHTRSSIVLGSPKEGTRVPLDAVLPALEEDPPG